MKSKKGEIKIYRGTYPPPPDRLAYPSVPVHQIMLNVTGSSVLEGRLDWGRWQTGFSTPGSFTFVRANQTQEWLWSHYAELLMLEFSPKLLDKIAVEGFDITPEKVELIDRYCITNNFNKDYFRQQYPFLLDKLCTTRFDLEHFAMSSILMIVIVIY